MYYRSKTWKIIRLLSGCGMNQYGYYSVKRASAAAAAAAYSIRPDAPARSITLLTEAADDVQN